MAHYCCTYMHELDDVNRWLPSEILKDIGITDTPERRRLAVVEDIASRLAGVLSGGASGIAQRPPASCHRPQVWNSGYSATPLRRDALPGAGRPRMAAPPPYFPPATPPPWLAMGGPPRSGRQILHPAAAASLQPARLVPSCPPMGSGAHQPLAAPATRRSGGTGVFLPRTDAVRPRPNKAAAAAARPPSNEPARQCRQARAIARRQQQERQAMAAAMVEQKQQFVDASGNGRPELALPQEWTY